MADTPTVEHHMVLYTDAGVRPTNPGFGGWGMHGYLYTEKVSKQSAGHPTHYPTPKGYFTKNEVRTSNDPEVVEVDIVQYYDGFGTLGSSISNNAGEIRAVIHALELVLKEKPVSALIRTDSEYTYLGITKRAKRWEKANWKQPSGQPYANKDEWLQLLGLDKQVKQAGIGLEYSWVNAHKGEPGNELADTYATMAVTMSRRMISRAELDVTPGKGYWRYDTERHPFLMSNNLYFLGSEAHIVKGLYYIGDHGRDDAMIGTRSVEGSFSVVVLDEPETLLESIRTQVSDLVKARDEPSPPLMIGRLSQVYRPDFHQLATKFDTAALYPQSATHVSLMSVTNGKEVVTDLRPALQGYRVLDAMESLHEILHQYTNGKKEYIETDITSALFEPTIVRKKPSLKLKDEFTTGFQRLEVAVNYDIGKGVEQTNIILITDSSIPSRNSLKRIEGLNPQVKVLTWRESEEVFRYATLIKIDGAVGIWAGLYSNYRYLFNKPSKKKKQP